MMASTEPELTLKIEKLIYGGWGLARCDEPQPDRFLGKQKVILVPDVLPGEEVRVKLISSRKDYAKATLIDVLTPSPSRSRPPCPVFGTCGGCHLQHMDPSAQAVYKQAMLKETLQRIGQITTSPQPIMTLSDPYHYRHRVQFRLLREGQSLKMGFYQRESHQLVGVEDCIILYPELEGVMKTLQKPLQGGLPFLLNPTEMHLQYSIHSAQVLIVFYGEGVEPEGLTKFYADLKKRMPLVGIVVYSKNMGREVRGQPFLLHRLKDMGFRISDQTFAQPNWTLNALITDKILQYAELKGRETVLELYSGMGNFGLFLARQARHVVAVESSPQAVKDAKYNAQLNHVTNFEIHHLKAEKGLARLLKNRPPIDLILLDPPRQGAGLFFLKQVCRLRVPGILYLSCEPTTLARDLKFLVQQGYQLRQIQPFDLLPQTYHLEVLVQLEKRAEV
jgi:23S rRNA (uracil1939-C5)-methyltransferase